MAAPNVLFPGNERAVPTNHDSGDATCLNPDKSAVSRKLRVDTREVGRRTAAKAVKHALPVTLHDARIRHRLVLMGLGYMEVEWTVLLRRG
jgi:hypothetical protein